MVGNAELIHFTGEGKIFNTVQVFNVVPNFIDVKIVFPLVASPLKG